MKKSLFILFALLIVGLPTFATITPEESQSSSYIINHGGSVEMARLINLQKAQINGGDTTYKSTTAAWYTSKAPKILTEKRVNFVRRAFMYFDCGLDDEKFMQHDTHFTSRYDDL